MRRDNFGILSTEYVMLTAGQEDLIAQFKAASDEASSIDPYDQATIARLAALDEQLRELSKKLEAAGLSMNSAGEWGFTRATR
jgi:hypothetical protein